MDMGESKSKVKITYGMANIQKNAARKCPNCSLGIGVYPGRYPEKCPECGASLKPTVEEQIALTRRGVPPKDVVRAVQEGLNLGYVHECLDSGMLAEDAVSSILDAPGKLWRGAKAAKQRVSAHAKGQGSKVRKNIADIGAESKKKKERKQQALANKAKREREAKAREAQENREKAKNKSNRERAKAKKERENAASKKKPKKESSMNESVNWQRTPMGPQVDAIRYAIGKQISEQGFATLNKLQAKFRANPVALKNMIREHQEAWNVILTETGGKVYPRKQGDQITE